MARVGGERNVDRRTVGRGVVTVRAEVVLHVAGAVRGLRVHVAVELTEDLAVALADDVRQDVQPAAVRHADHDLVETSLRRLVKQAVEQRDQRLAAFERESLLADVLRLQERLERLGDVEPVQDVELLLATCLAVREFDAVLNPPSLFGVGDVHVLDADRATVRVAQHAENVAQLHDGDATEATGREFAIEIPQREVVIHDVEVGMLAHLELQRVGVGHQVAAHPVGMDQLDDASRLADLVVVRRDDVLHPAHRLVGDAQGPEQVVVETVFAEQQPMDLPQELTRLCTLDHPVVIGRGDRHDLADGEVGQRLGRCPLELGRVFHRADADDAALTLHQPRHRVDGAQRAGVGQRHRRAGEVVGRQLVGAGPPNDVFIGCPELCEVEVLRALDRRNQELAGAVVLGHVDGESEIDVVMPDRCPACRRSRCTRRSFPAAPRSP